ncbi:MAG: hypothetical protein K1X68_07605 [Saprospiraceae bacterium]|nr:hypothetical protein [Saprospiraceae bacterium]HMW39999.1 hypothetical protein [Saprospiraceae bacterium]HMX87873.1 hypothetical protein [Saprospiraceae bacterium]HMZ39721.1 hypothetical protein [Saprospiraceae bacterium]HNA64258.1 hypothetical protein [Saprospiraceae bacterium]
MRIFLMLAIFGIFVLFNLYIRVRTMNFYRQLVRNRIQFNFADMFNRNKWDSVLEKYPQHQELMNRFRVHIINTGALFVSSVFLVIFLLIIFRHN